MYFIFGRRTRCCTELGLDSWLGLFSFAFILIRPVGELVVRSAHISSLRPLTFSVNGQYVTSNGTPSTPTNRILRFTH